VDGTAVAVRYIRSVVNKYEFYCVVVIVTSYVTQFSGTKHIYANSMHNKRHKAGCIRQYAVSTN